MPQNLRDEEGEDQTSAYICCEHSELVSSTIELFYIASPKPEATIFKTLIMKLDYVGKHTQPN